MPIVNVAIVPELMAGERAPQYNAIAEGITNAIVSSTGAPADSVHILFSEVSDSKYAVGGTMLRDSMARRSPEN